MGATASALASFKAEPAATPLTLPQTTTPMKLQEEKEETQGKPVQEELQETTPTNPTKRRRLDEYTSSDAPLQDDDKEEEEEEHHSDDEDDASEDHYEETDDVIRLTVDVPGVKNLLVKIENGVLYVEGSRLKGKKRFKFRKNFPSPE